MAKAYPKIAYCATTLRIAELEGRSKEDLIDLILQMVESCPAVLSVLGVEGFEEDEEGRDEW